MPGGEAADGADALPLEPLHHEPQGVGGVEIAPFAQLPVAVPGGLAALLGRTQQQGFFTVLVLS